MEFDTREGMPVTELREHRAFWVAASVRENATKRGAEFRAMYPSLVEYELDPETLVARRARLVELFANSAEHDVNPFLQWIEAHFELAEELTVDKVIESDIRSNWTLADYETLEPHLFRVAALHAAGFGAIIDPEDWSNDGRLFAEIACLSGNKMSIEAHDINSGHVVRLLVNGRVYEFEMSDDWSWYDNRPACDVLNAILDRQKIKERFFVFEKAYGNSYVKFVMFADPLKVKTFVEQVDDFTVVKGCEKLWLAPDK